MINDYLLMVPAIGGEELTRQVTILATGLMVVMSVLILLWFVLELMGSVFKYLQPASVQSTRTPVAPASTKKYNDEVTPEVVAVVASALHTVIKDPFRINSIQPADKKLKPAMQAWSFEGRRQISHSHKIR